MMNTFLYLALRDRQVMYTSLRTCHTRDSACMFVHSSVKRKLTSPPPLQPHVNSAASRNFLDRSHLEVNYEGRT
jgi:hypothetical protein